MKVVIATPLYPPEIGGPATYAEALVAGLPRYGIETTLVRFSQVRHLPKLVRHYAYYRRVLLAAQDADLILALDPVSVGLPAMRAAKKLRKKFAVKVVGDYAWEQGVQRFGVRHTLDAFLEKKGGPLPVRLLRHIEVRVASAADRIIVPSAYLARIVAAWGIAPERITVVYNAVRGKAPGELPAAIAALPHPLIVSAGRLVPWKRMSGVIEALIGMNASLAIVGEGPEHETLMRQAREALGDRAILTGSLPHASVLAALQAADIFVLNSTYEGLSHVLIEALSLGTAVVATRAGGNAELIEDGETGLLVAPDDPHALHGALARLLADMPLRIRLAAAGKESAKCFSEEAMLAHSVELLTAL